VFDSVDAITENLGSFGVAAQQERARPEQMKRPVAIAGLQRQRAADVFYPRLGLAQIDQNISVRRMRQSVIGAEGQGAFSRGTRAIQILLPNLRHAGYVMQAGVVRHLLQRSSAKAGR